MSKILSSLDQATALSVGGLMLIGGAIGLSIFSIWKGYPIQDAVNSTLAWVTMGLSCLGINFGFRLARIAKSGE